MEKRLINGNTYFFKTLHTQKFKTFEHIVNKNILNLRTHCMHQYLMPLNTLYRTTIALVNKHIFTTHDFRRVISETLQKV